MTKRNLIKRACAKGIQILIGMGFIDEIDATFRELERTVRLGIPEYADDVFGRGFLR